MPITILDYVKSKVGEKDSYPAADFFANGVDIMGGCEICAATIAAYNAYPSKAGYWRCGDCIADIGFATVVEFEASLLRAPACPACSGVSRITAAGGIDDNTDDDLVFRCGECGARWTP